MEAGRLWSMAAAAGLLCSLAGCTSLRLADIAAHDLPGSMRAHKPQGIQSLELAMLGRPVAGEYRLEPGDLVEVTISDLIEQYQAHATVTRVRPDGTILLPLVGDVNVREMSVPQSEQAIFTAYTSGGFLRRPQVIVNVREARPNRVYVIGGVRSPGMYELPRSESDLFAAIIAAGGLADEAGTVIEIRRRRITREPSRRQRWDRPARQQGRAIARQTAAEMPAGSQPWQTPSPHSSQPPHVGGFIVSPTDRGTGNPNRSDGTEVQPGQVLRYDLAQEGKDLKALADGVPVYDGDIVMIEQRKRQPIYVVGSVRRPGRYELPLDRELRVLQAIAGAGGVNPQTSPSKALVIRRLPGGGGVTVIKVDLRRAKKDMSENLILMPGDTISVEETIGSFCRGILRNAFRFGIGAEYNALGPTGYRF